MTVRFYILQAHYRSTLDFSDDALQAAEKAYKRLSDSYDLLGKLKTSATSTSDIKSLRQKSYDALNDDFNTAKVLANMFELVPIINGIKDKHISSDALSTDTLQLLKTKMKIFIEDILGLQNIREQTDGKIDGIIQLLMKIRKEARSRKDYVTSDKIRNELAALGVQLKDEKDGNMSYVFI